uniref:ATP synthase complex subunit 8 n=1 Tax=Cerylon histeroides TaxID=347309 RepID=E3VTE0_9CUCU|nr:ATP synthase F0 subunit 8 [Cerylon histeroides]
MPQMAPLSWMMLYLMFLCIFIIFNLLNFYQFKYLPNYSFKQTKISKINWLW